MLQLLQNITGIKRAVREQTSQQGTGLVDDVRDVITASDLLQVGEFRLFELAHRRWFGKDADETALERQFVQYMFAQRAPAWVRHFARDVIARHRRDRLDPTEFGLPPLPKQNVESKIIRVCNEVMMALWVAAVYASWSFQAG